MCVITTVFVPHQKKQTILLHKIALTYNRTFDKIVYAKLLKLDEPTFKVFHNHKLIKLLKF